MRSAPSYEFVEDVTSDLSFVARGETLSAVFAAAAAALLATTVEDPEALGSSEERRLELAEPDLELLLLVFLNELVYLRDAEGLLMRVQHLAVAEGAGEARLAAHLVGEALDPTRQKLAGDVKAVTAHGLRLARTPDGFQATVTLDV